MAGLGQRHKNKTLAEVKKGVTIRFLAGVFGMSEALVKRRLQPVAPVANGRGGSDLYQFDEACAYLVKPVMPMEEWVKTLKMSDLPDRLRESFWNAQIKEQKFRANAKDLWNSPDVMGAFADLLSIMRTNLQLLVDNVEREHGLTDEQRLTLVQMVDDIQDELYRKVLDYSKENKAGPQEDDLPWPKDYSSLRKEAADLI